MSIKKIVIFGATGMTGLCALEAAVKAGFNIRVLVRDPEKVPKEFLDKVEIQKGDVLNEADVIKAVEGVDGVVIILGTRNDVSPTTVLSTGTNNIIKAMKSAGVKPVSVCLSAFLFYELDKVPKMFVHLNDEHLKMYNAIKDSGLDYIAVNPPHIAPEPNGDVKVGINPKESPGRAISKWDLGAFLVNSLNNKEYYKTFIGICNPPKA